MKIPKDHKQVEVQVLSLFYGGLEESISRLREAAEGMVSPELRRNYGFYDDIEITIVGYRPMTDEEKAQAKHERKEIVRLHELARKYGKEIS